MKANLLKTIVVLLVAVAGTMCINAQKAHVYINPGHGGHTSDDRNVVIAPYAQGDTAGYYESNSNMWKGFAMMEVLKKKGYTTSISRVRNEQSDDLNLSTIVELCNSSGADVFYSIHSNATGAGDGYRINFPLGLYRGYTGQPKVKDSDVIADILMKILLANKSTVWTQSNYQVSGDWTFYPSWGTQGLGVLRGNNAVSMLSEGSFHDYIPEAYRLHNLDFCWVEGFNFSRAVDEYFGNTADYDLGIVTGNLRDDRMLRTATYVMHGDDVRQPIENAVVRLLNEAGEEVARTTTDDCQSGIYLFKYVAPGKYKVEASETEHFTQTKDIEVVANEPTYCNFDLKRMRLTPPEVVSYSPVWQDGDPALLCNVPIVLNFNWDMDIPSTEAAFSITPAVDGTFTWEDTNYRMIFTPNDAFDINTEYTVTLAASAQHGGGTPMERDFSFRFVTQGRNHLYPTVVFPQEGVGVHYQSATLELRADSLLHSQNLFTLFHVLDKDGNEVAFNKRSIKNNKKGDDYGYIRIPLSGSLTVGDEYTLNIERDVCDTVGIHLVAPISYKFKAVDAGAEKPDALIINDMEEATAMTATGNYKTATLAASTTKLFGSKSLQVKYDFTGIDDPAVVLEFATMPDVTFTGNDSVCAHLWGDLSCNKVVALMEHGAETVEVPMETIDFHGWRYVKACVNAGSETYRLKGFRIDGDPANKPGQSGTMYIDNVLMLVGEASGIADVALAGVVVGPNPASDYIVASADVLIDGMQLFDLQGREVKRNAGNYVNVSNLTPGTYIVKVHVGAQTSTHKVIVR